jgi:hypothetical protein
MREVLRVDVAACKTFKRLLKKGSSDFLVGGGTPDLEALVPAARAHWSENSRKRLL